MIFEWFNRLFEHNDKVNKTLYEEMRESFSIMHNIFDALMESMPSLIGVGNSWTGWSKPNIKHKNTGNNNIIYNYKNYRLRNTARFPRTTYYRVRRKR